MGERTPARPASVVALDADGSVDPFLDGNSRLPYAVARTVDGSLLFERRWWPLFLRRDVPGLIEDRHLAHLVFLSALGGAAALISNVIGGDKRTIQNLLLAGLVVLGTLGAMIARSRQASFIAFDRERRELRRGRDSWSFRALGEARPRAVSLGDREHPDWEVRVTLPSGEVLALARYGRREAADTLVATIHGLLSR